MKNAAIISFAIVLAFMPVFASASAGMGFLLDTSEARLCSCSTTQITGTLSSDGYGLYTIKSDSKWITIAPDTISLTPGESTPVYIYLTADCVSPPKDYPIEITAKSDAGLSVSRQITATILPCHNVALDVSPKETKTCLEEDARFLINVTNNGKASEDFIISTTAGILETKRITLNRDETKTIAMDIPANDTYKEAIIIARSASTYAADSETVKISGINCHSAEMSVSPQEGFACLGDAVNYTVMLRNTGTRTDTFKLNSSFGALSDGSVSLNAGESKQLTLSAASGNAGNYSFGITAISRFTKAEANGMFRAVQCRGVLASIAPAEQTICKGFPVNYSVQVKNTGVLDDAYSLTSTLGVFEKEKVSVQKGASTGAVLSIPETGLGDKNSVSIKATSLGDSNVAAFANAVLYAENCYKLNGTANVSETKICAGKTALFEIGLQNTGKLSDDYVVNASLGGISERYISLKPGEKTTLTVTIPTELSDSGKRNISLSIASRNASFAKNLSLEIEPAKDCYGFSIAAKEDILFTNDSIGKLFEIKIENLGKDISNFTAALDGPVWAYISPREFTLQKGKNATIYVYAAPSYGTKDDAYLLKIAVNTSAGLSKTEFVQLVLGNATPYDLSRLRGEKAPAKPVSFFKSKAFYIIILGIVIIAIIIFGPGLFKKKKAEEKEAEEKEELEEMIGADKIATIEAKEEPEEMKEEAEKEAPEEKKKPKKKRKTKKEFQDVLDRV